jgi:hypothetical protein
MERIINIHIEKLPEGFFLATSDNIQGLVAQGERSQRHWKLPVMWPGSLLNHRRS